MLDELSRESTFKDESLSFRDLKEALVSDETLNRLDSASILCGSGTSDDQEDIFLQTFLDGSAMESAVFAFNNDGLLGEDEMLTDAPYYGSESPYAMQKTMQGRLEEEVWNFNTNSTLPDYHLESSENERSLEGLQKRTVDFRDLLYTLDRSETGTPTNIGETTLAEEDFNVKEESLAVSESDERESADEGSLKRQDISSSHEITSKASDSKTMKGEMDFASYLDGPFKIGAYTPNERRQLLMRFREKKSRRSYTKKIKYMKRKALAENRLRIQGRFIKKGEEHLYGHLLSK